MAKKKESKKQKQKIEKETHPFEIPPFLPTPTKGMILLSFSFLMLLSSISFILPPYSNNWIGLVGEAVGFLLHYTFGLGNFLFLGYLIWIGYHWLFNEEVPEKHPLTFSLLTLSFCILITQLEVGGFNLRSLFSKTLYGYETGYLYLIGKDFTYHFGGKLSYYLYNEVPYINLKKLLNTYGVTLIFSSTLLTTLLMLNNVQFYDLYSRLSSLINLRTRDRRLDEEPEEREGGLLRFVKLKLRKLSEAESGSDEEEVIEITPETVIESRPTLSKKTELSKKEIPFETLERIKAREEEREIPTTTPREVKTPVREPAAPKSPSTFSGDFSNYKLPPLHLLSNPEKVNNSSIKKDLKQQAEVLEETLLSFGIQAKVGQINCGPTITSFEVHPPVGVKVQRIKALENDIALNMEAKSIRIIAPIPGKAAVGIEIPNSQPQEVSFKGMVRSYLQEKQKLNIPLFLGETVAGEMVCSDLAKMPHCIIAGATGSGKSVCINSIVMSILMNRTPDEVRLLMVDPKKVELTPYNDLPHMIAPVITEPQGACDALKWLVKEMEYRYEVLRQIGTRNIAAFNSRKIDKEKEEKIEKRTGREVPKKLPFIVGIIDELADLMMVSSSDIETPIARIAQMARAVGIHLILATQRPSREVITGLIKANFPTRISFKVASRINSQIIIDEVGAESLLGNGDMLYLPPGTSTLMRAQGPFVRDGDINRVVEWITKRFPTHYVIDSFDQTTSFNSLELNPEQEDLDSLFVQARDIVVGTGNASTTFLQRKLKVGYARAASLMDQLEEQKIVGPPDGSKPRKILVRTEGVDDEEEN